MLALASIGFVLTDANSPGSCSYASGGLVVQTTSARAHGFINESTPGGRQLRDVPFAQISVRPLRWLPPQQLAAHSSIDRHPSYHVGSQLFPDYFHLGVHLDRGHIDTPQFDVIGTLSEDCLSLSVYALQNPASAARSSGDELLPVMVWMYGGGMVMGGQQVLYLDLSHWI